MTRRGQKMRAPLPARQQPNLHQQEARMFRRGNEQDAGWCQPMPQGFWHYFRAGDVLSLCGRWMFSGRPREDNGHDRADTCADCARLRPQFAEGRA